MIDTVIVLDTETDSLDPPPKGRCLEVAVALYSVRHGAVVMTYSSLIHSPNGNAAEVINGIPHSLVQNGCSDAQDVWKEVADMCHGSTAILAHFAEFDMKFVDRGLLVFPWICTANDLEWPRGSSSRSLVSLALAHGLGVSHAHRAMVDVDLICRLLTKVYDMGISLDSFLEYGLRPKAHYVSLEPYSNKAIVKAHKFQWDGSIWSRTMAIEDAEKLPFKVERVG